MLVMLVLNSRLGHTRQALNHWTQSPFSTVSNKKRTEHSHSALSLWGYWEVKTSNLKSPGSDTLGKGQLQENGLYADLYCGSLKPQGREIFLNIIPKGWLGTSGLWIMKLYVFLGYECSSFWLFSSPACHLPDWRAWQKCTGRAPPREACGLS